MKKIALGFAVTLGVVIFGAYWMLADDPVVYEPSDLSDLMTTPDSPFVISDISDLKDKVIIERDLAVVTRDGTRLSANVFRPKSADKVPVILTITAYHKDEGLAQYPDIMRFNAREDFDVGPMRVSEWTHWEGPDPAYWVKQGYAVVTLDARGYGKSEGVATVVSKQDRDDFHDAIKWAGTQGWSNGNVGLTGVSYLAIAQWAAASGTPPEQLKAIMPWEGQTDAFRDVMFHGGIPETAFAPSWIVRAKQKANESSLPPNAVFNFVRTRPFLFKWVQDKIQPPSGIDLETINIPALIAASWSDQGLHTRGTFEAYKRISSKQKWLYTHGGPKWAVYYSDEAKRIQTAFFDYFLKGEENGFDKRPRVRLEVRDSLKGYTVRDEADWPLPSTQYNTLYLDAANATLSEIAPSQENAAQYNAKTGGVVFRKTFDAQTELTGNMKLRLWVQADGADDMDLFVAVRKYDAMGKEVMFYGKTGFKNTPAALGWLRVSHRELDKGLSTPAQPVLTHQQSQMLNVGEIVPVDIEILPSSTRFENGETLEVSIQGRDQFIHPTLAHSDTVNTGTHMIHAGGKYDSHLLVPVIPTAQAEN